MFTTTTTCPKCNELARLLIECRDALPAISLASARLHGVRLDLANRIERSLEPWEVPLDNTLGSSVLAFDHFIGPSELEDAMGKLYAYAVEHHIKVIGLPGPIVCDGCMHRLQLIERTLENGTTQIHIEVM